MKKPYLFFSIIIPAHNEERYIEATLERIASFDYSVDKYEAIVVENGSNDRTYEAAKRFEKGNISVLNITAGPLFFLFGILSPYFLTSFSAGLSNKVIR